MKLAWLVATAVILGGCGPSIKIDSLKQAAVAPDRRAALAAIEATYEAAPWHQQTIEKVAVLAASSPHNITVFPRVADLMARCSYQTMVLYGVAQAAARSPLELAEWGDLAELAVLKLSGTQAVVDLADRAAQITDPDEVPQLRDQIRLLRATAECQSVDEAIQRVARLVQGLDSAVKK